ncbi:MAG: zinc ribbon domain-containing protein [Candidatus Aminicenantes bacterium]|nr:MAG: zinc ribbon domain-containing protein [Candidatus Aminicenantes bacterium]
MPIYEYKCLKCGSVLEVLQKISDRPLKKCPKCKGPLKKVISPPALQFKGNGWYITDYAQKKKPEREPKAESKTKKEKDSAQKKKSSSPSASE